MSTRILNSRFNSAERRGARVAGRRAAPAPLPQKEVVPPPEPTMPPVETLNVRFGFVTLFGKLTVIEVSEEVWGNRRYYTAAFSADPAVCIKALDLEEAVSTLLRHLVRSPSLRRFHFEQGASPA